MKKVLRCKITGNLCGTDTWIKNHPCECINCQKYLGQIKDKKESWKNICITFIQKNNIGDNKLKKSQTHQERHIFLHKCFDELLADFIGHTNKLPSETTLIDFMNWSHSQTVKPTEK